MLYLIVKLTILLVLIEEYLQIFLLAVSVQPTGWFVGGRNTVMCYVEGPRDEGLVSEFCGTVVRRQT
jgi:hypothetical protein